MTGQIYPLIAGMLAAGFSVAALFFLRFWATTRDRLFAWFALAFALLAAQRIATVIGPHWTDATLWMYLLRLVAFLLILAAIIDKNRPSPRPGGSA